MADKIRVTRDDLYDGKIEDILAEQQSLRAVETANQPTPLWRRIVFSSVFFLSVAGALGGTIGWLVLEPLFNESAVLWGTIDSIELASLGDTQGQVMVVRGKHILVHEAVTRVDGRGEYAGTDSVSDLAPGRPVRATVMPVGDLGGLLMAQRVTACEIPPEHKDEPLPDFESRATVSLLGGIFSFAIVGSCIAGLIAAADGLVSRNWRRGILSGACGMGLAAGGGLLGLIPAGLVFGLSLALVGALAGTIWTTDTVSGAAFLALVIGRSLTWGVLGLTVGLGPGAALRSKKLFVNGLIGGMLGGLLGGLFFDPICKLFAATSLGGQALVSRALGFSIIGLCAGGMIGLVEHMAKDAWLLMRAGPLRGKQFVIYKSPTVLGSSPKSEVYLFKDPDVEPRHALIHKLGSRCEIEDLGTPAGTFVNGRAVRRQVLQDGDEITIGGTALRYEERARRSEWS